ncbi:hypothetical protein NQZ79_g8449 [Umbelopsis isabellina]|nr:hypothetical protein NQZ79_g8449 [Umbelopsis isabellina]
MATSHVDISSAMNANFSPETIQSAASSSVKKRKVSCLSCRARKTKCDGQKPCAKCLLRGKSQECVYAQTSGPVGRPPKNAVVNKMVRMSQSSEARQQFVYENLSFVGLSDYTKFLTSSYQRDHLSDDGSRLSDYITGIFSVYFGTGLRFDDDNDTGNLPNAVLVRGDTIFQMLDLKQHFNWLSAEGVGYCTGRISELKLENFKELDIYGHILRKDRSDRFFDKPGSSTYTETVRPSPLKSLSVQQALQLIDMFFTVHPWAPFVLNRTQILQQYFTESSDPLLLAVMFGIAKFFAKQMKDGGVTAAAVQRGDTNEFLNYAHSVLEETSAKATVPKVQAVVLLSYFELIYGQAKRGTTLIALSYIMLNQLSLNDDFNYKHPHSIAGLGSLQIELLRNCWWCVYSNTVTGTIEFGQVPREAIAPRDVPLPSINCQQSESYKLDVSANNTSMFIAYKHIYESFYVACAVTDLLAKIWLVLPEPDRNMFRTVPNMRQLQKCPPQVKRASVQEQITDLLGDFEAFITAQYKKLTEQQYFQLEVTKVILSIHNYFLKAELDTSEAMVYVSAIRSLYFKDDNYQIVTRIPSYSDKTERLPFLDRESVPAHVMVVVLPLALDLIDRCQAFLKKREGKTDLLQKAPAWLILIAMETCGNIKRFLARWAPQHDPMGQAALMKFSNSPSPDYDDIVQLMNMAPDASSDMVSTDGSYGASSAFEFENHTKPDGAERSVERANVHEHAYATERLVKCVIIAADRPIECAITIL